jgi:MFS family permease
VGGGGSAGFRAGLAQLREREFARLFAATLISVFGSAMTPIAVAFAVLERDGSPRAVGLVIAAQTGAQVSVQLLAGALADRWSRKGLMVAADLLAAAGQAALALLILGHTGSTTALAALMAASGVSFAVALPAALGLIAQFVPRERLQGANALLSLARNGALGLGGAAAGLIVPPRGQAGRSRSTPRASWPAPG